VNIRNFAPSGHRIIEVQLFDVLTGGFVVSVSADAHTLIPKETIKIMEQKGEQLSILLAMVNLGF
jgi:archaellum component FlaF (FlaF/FlaG flagellin family)